MFTTPSGIPAFLMCSASANTERQASSAGLTTIEQPVARAGAIFHTAIINGAFQGMMAPITPTGSRTVQAKYSPGIAGATGMVRPSILLGHPAISRNVDTE